MSLRSKTKRRLLLLIGLCLIVAAGVFWAFRPAARNTAQTTELRRAAMADYNKGDYLSAMPQLSRYLSDVKIHQKEPSDEELEALFAFGDCRRRIPMPRQLHLREADQAFERYLSYRPNDAAAQTIHLKVLSGTWMTTAMGSGPPQFKEARLLADRILERDPRNIEALFARAYSTSRLAKPNLDEVDAAIAELLKVDPGHVNGLILSQQVQLRRGASPKQLIDRIEPLAQSHEQDPRFKLVAAETFYMLALSDAGKADPAAQSDWARRGREWLLKAADQPAINAEFAMMTASSLDRVMMTPRTIKYLITSLDAVKPDDEHRDRLHKTLVRRLWQNNVYEEVLTRTQDLNHSDNNTDADLLAYRAITLSAKATSPGAGDDRTRLLNEADAIARALRSRAASHEAQSWAVLLKLDAGATKPAAKDVIELCKDAREKNPENAVAAVRLGDAFAQQGETDAAVQMWSWASRLAPDWGYPVARIAETRLDEGRFDEAARRADQARLLDPRSQQFLALLALTRYASLPKNPNPAVVAAQLADIETIQSAYPFEGGTLPLQVSLLARVKGAAAAKQRITEALAAKPAVSLETLLRLQATSDAERLGMEEPILAAIAKHDGAALPLTAQNARQLLADGKAAEGLQLLLDARTKAGAATDPRWLLAVAVYRDAANDPGATAAWAELAEHTPTELYYQSQILKSPSRNRDRALWLKTIDRVRTLTGDDGTLWKLEKARWVLAGPEVEKDRAEAIALLTELTQRNQDSAEARRLLGLALMRDQKFSRAAEELNGALQMAPTRGEIGLELINALRLAGDLSTARARLKEVAAIPSLSSEQQLRVAAHLQDLGQQDDAIRVLSTMPEGGERDARLGSLYRSVGRLDDAAAAYSRVLNDVAARPEDVFAGADFFASVTEEKKAQYFLDRLQTMPQSQATTQMLLGQFKERYARADEALAHLKQATTLEPKNPLTWKALSGFQLRSRRYDDAIAAADAGLAAVPGDPALSAIKPLVARVRKLTDVEPYRVLIDQLTRQPTNEAATATLAILADADAAMAAVPQEQKRQVGAKLLEKLVPLAEQHQDFWTLQELTILFHLRSGRPDKAAALADRATAMSPALPDPPRLACEAYMRQAKWDKVIESATIWRQRAAGDPLPADLTRAEAMLAQRQPAGAVRTLEPHVQARPLPAKPSAGQSIDPRALTLYGTYARALIEQGRANDAAERLAPVLASGEDGRSVWLLLTDVIPTDSAARQWIEKAVAAMPAELSTVDRLSLAKAYLSAGRPSAAKDLLDLAAKAIEPLIAPPRPLPEALRVAALIAHARADYTAAESHWRLLKTVQDVPDNANNLAYALLLSGRPEVVAEAHALVRQAIQSDPENSVYLSTLANSHAKMGARDLAIATYRKAMAIDASSTEAMLGLADILAGGSMPERSEARKLLSSARTIMQQTPRQSDPELIRHAEKVQARVDVDGK